MHIHQNSTLLTSQKAVLLSALRQWHYCLETVELKLADGRTDGHDCLRLFSFVHCVYTQRNHCNIWKQHLNFSHLSLRVTHMELSRTNITHAGYLIDTIACTYGTWLKCLLFLQGSTAQRIENTQFSIFCRIHKGNGDIFWLIFDHPGQWCVSEWPNLHCLYIDVCLYLTSSLWIY